MTKTPQSINNTDLTKKEVSKSIPQLKKSQLGQFLTSVAIAKFMARMFKTSAHRNCKLLDAGAGVGALSCAFLDQIGSYAIPFDSVSIDAIEIDTTLAKYLKNHLDAYSNVNVNIIPADFIHLSTEKLPLRQDYTHVILNPPYKKISSTSLHRKTLRKAGIETVNLYSAFVALAIEQTKIGGQIVAILPRSFCNGPYYKSFRDLLLDKTAIQQIHLFESRSSAFREDQVLQENIIIHLTKGVKQTDVIITTSTDDTFSDIDTACHAFERIVFPEDGHRYIHIPTSTNLGKLELSPAVRFKLDDLGIKVSTGPVVDFRLREHLRDIPTESTVPLIYPSHFKGVQMIWPVVGSRKPNAILRNIETEKWLYPLGYYCVVRRFSSKEEKRRIVASVVDPSLLREFSAIGLENHLNVFHENKQGLSKELAWGLATFLNMSAVDESFRRFNGHTQVNATDLKLMKYPNREALIKLGRWAIEQQTLSPESIDQQLEILAA